MARYRQCYLGKSAQGTLSLVPRKPPRLSPILRRYPPVSLGECFIFTLPEEIVVDIFSYLPHQNYYWAGSEKEDEMQVPLPLTLVCRSWRRVFEPMLFQEIRLGSSRCIHQLAEIFEKRPELRIYPRQIHISFNWRTDFLHHLVTKIVEYCRAVRTISLNMYLGGESLPLLRAIKSRPLLQELRLYRPSLYLIMKHFDMPTLRCLRVVSYAVGRTAFDYNGWPGTKTASNTQMALEKLLPASRYHTGAMTSFELSDPRALLSVSEHLLRWPSRLEKLSIVSFNEPETESHEPRHIKQLISIHHKSLKYITLGRISCRVQRQGYSTNRYRGTMPDFSDFPCLEELRISYLNVFFEIPSHAAQMLAAPSLRYLEITLKYHVFNATHVAWLLDFVPLIKSQYPTSRLEKIFFNFDSKIYSPYKSIWKVHKFWPWQYLEQARQDVSKYGLILEYSKPTWTKEEWNMIVRETLHADRAFHPGSASHVNQSFDPRNVHYDDRVVLANRGSSSSV